MKHLPSRILQEWRSFVGALLGGDRAASRAHALRLGFVDAGSDAGVDRVVEALSRLYLPYLPFRPDERRRFPSLWADLSVSDILGKPLTDVRSRLRVPKDLVFVNRTLAGMSMVLSRLGAVASWGGIARECVRGEPPSTPLGAAERAWAAGATSTNARVGEAGRPAPSLPPRALRVALPRAPAANVPATGSYSSALAGRPELL